MRKARLLAWLLAIPCSEGLAEVYKTVDEYGNVRYSDTPSEQSETVELGKINLQPPVTARPSPANTRSPAATQSQSNSAKAARLAGESKPAPSPSPQPQKRVSSSPGITPEQPEEKSAAQSPYGLRIALPKAGSTLSNAGTPITLVLLTTKFLSEGERFQATVNGQPSGEASRANNLSIHLPKNPEASVLLGASIINQQGQVLEQAAAIEIYTQ